MVARDPRPALRSDLGCSISARWASRRRADGYHEVPCPWLGVGMTCRDDSANNGIAWSVSCCFAPKNLLATPRAACAQKGPERLGLPLGADLPIPGSVEESIPSKRYRL